MCYGSFSEDRLELDTAHLFLRPVFMINDVAKMLDRKPDTIRKYEKRGLTAVAKQYKINKSGGHRRFYTEEDILELADFFAARRSVGRPSNKKHISKINKYNLNTLLQTRFKEQHDNN
jgi:DNA-binding transcriptional MerR regulator